MHRLYLHRNIQDLLLRLQPVLSEHLSVCPMLLLQLCSLRQLYRFFPERRSCRSVLQLRLLLPGHHRMLLLCQQHLRLLLYLQHLRLLLYLLFPLLLPLQCHQKHKCLQIPSL